MVTREEVINLVNQMPLEKLVSWYEYGLFIQSQPVRVAPSTAADEEEDALQFVICCSRHQASINNHKYAQP